MLYAQVSKDRARTDNLKNNCLPEMFSNSSKLEMMFSQSQKSL